MLNGCLDSLFGVRSLDNKEFRNPKVVKDAPLSIGSSLNSKEFYVRIVHAGGKEDLYRNPIVVSQLIKRYPGMCFAWPEVFKNPYEAVLSATDMLLPGQKYLLLPVTTLKKLKKRHSARKNKSTGKQVTDESDDSVCSANDYYVSKEKWSRSLVKKHIQSNRQGIPPLVLKSKSKSGRGSDWEPSLTSIQELSP
ncbi:hypothetical protein CTI12_AA589270 [Artemisia annua]|uniref:Uncharacterized protein n=1 Tax=Artemisia annua TaxID=35608 RepID=A0A2U1KLV3_ARTAN|nr:hypothetical protein CTI12_AA589270 [Artemisia annua]